MQKCKALAALIAMITTIVATSGCFSAQDTQSTESASSGLENSSSNAEEVVKITFSDYGSTSSQTIKLGGKITPPTPKGVANFTFAGWWNGEKYADFSTELCKGDITYRAEYGANRDLEIFSENPIVERYGAYELLDEYEGEDNVYKLTVSPQNTDMYMSVKTPYQILPSACYTYKVFIPSGSFTDRNGNAVDEPEIETQYRWYDYVHCWAYDTTTLVENTCNQPLVYGEWVEIFVYNEESLPNGSIKLRTSNVEAAMGVAHTWDHSGYLYSVYVSDIKIPEGLTKADAEKIVAIYKQIKALKGTNVASANYGKHCDNILNELKMLGEYKRSFVMNTKTFALLYEAHYGQKPIY